MCPSYPTGAKLHDVCDNVMLVGTILSTSTTAQSGSDTYLTAAETKQPEPVPIFLRSIGWIKLVHQASRTNIILG